MFRIAPESYPTTRTELPIAVIPSVLRGPFTLLSNVVLYYFDYVMRIPEKGSGLNRVGILTSEQLIIATLEGCIKRCIRLIAIEEIVIERGSSHVLIRVPSEYDLLLKVIRGKEAMVRCLTVMARDAKTRAPQPSGTVKVTQADRINRTGLRCPKGQQKKRQLFFDDLEHKPPPASKSCPPSPVSNYRRAQSITFRDSILGKADLSPFEPFSKTPPFHPAARGPVQFSDGGNQIPVVSDSSQSNRTNGSPVDSPRVGPAADGHKDALPCKSNGELQAAKHERRASSPHTAARCQPHPNERSPLSLGLMFTDLQLSQKSPQRRQLEDGRSRSDFALHPAFHEPDLDTPLPVGNFTSPESPYQDAIAVKRVFLGQGQGPSYTTTTAHAARSPASLHPRQLVDMICKDVSPMSAGTPVTAGFTSPESPQPRQLAHDAIRKDFASTGTGQVQDTRTSLATGCLASSPESPQPRQRVVGTDFAQKLAFHGQGPDTRTPFPTGRLVSSPESPQPRNEIFQKVKPVFGGHDPNSRSPITVGQQRSEGAPAPQTRIHPIALPPGQDALCLMPAFPTRFDSPTSGYGTEQPSKQGFHESPFDATFTGQKLFGTSLGRSRSTRDTAHSAHFGSQHRSPTSFLVEGQPAKQRFGASANRNRMEPRCSAVRSPLSPELCGGTYKSSRRLRDDDRDSGDEPEAVATLERSVSAVPCGEITIQRELSMHARTDGMLAPRGHVASAAAVQHEEAIPAWWAQLRHGSSAHAAVTPSSPRSTTRARFSPPPALTKPKSPSSGTTCTPLSPFTPGTDVDGQNLSSSNPCDIRQQIANLGPKELPSVRRPELR